MLLFLLLRGIAVSWQHQWPAPKGTTYNTNCLQYKHFARIFAIECTITVRIMIKWNLRICHFFFRSTKNPVIIWGQSQHFFPAAERRDARMVQMLLIEVEEEKHRKYPQQRKQKKRCWCLRSGFSSSPSSKFALSLDLPIIGFELSKNSLGFMLVMVSRTINITRKLFSIAIYTMPICVLWPSYILFVRVQWNKSRSGKKANEKSHAHSLSFNGLLRYKWHIFLVE